MDIIKGAVANKDQLIFSFIDFKSAYNYVSRKLIYQVIREKQILNNDELAFLEGIQNNQYFEKIDGSKMQLTRGVPQGSPLSPHFIDTLKGKIGSDSLQTIIFADDLVIIYHQGLNIKVMDTIELIQREFQMIVNKSKQGVFMLNQNQDVQNIRGYPVLKEYKYLRVIRDYKRTIDSHINKLIQRVAFVQKKIYWISKDFSFKNKLLLWKLFLLPLPVCCAIFNNEQQLGVRNQGQIEPYLKEMLKEVFKSPNIAGTLGQWAYKLSKQRTQQIKARKQSPMQQQRILDAVSLYLSRQEISLGEIRHPNLPDNLHKLFRQQWMLCEEYRRHLTDNHILDNHLSIEMKKQKEEFKGEVKMEGKMEVKSDLWGKKPYKHGQRQQEAEGSQLKKCQNGQMINQVYVSPLNGLIKSNQI
ncbi:hypothetical protein pb186bvf_016932 [Paramecium bursaria]